jgi:hypothetical protein
MEPSGLVTHGNALHKFFVRKYRARDVASDGLHVLPGRQPYFDGLVGRNLVVREGNSWILRCMMDAYSPAGGLLTEGKCFVGVSDNEVAPLRTDVGLGGDHKLYKAATPYLREPDTNEDYIESSAWFSNAEAVFLWARATLCLYDDNTNPPTDDTVAGCYNFGFAMLDQDMNKPNNEVWRLTSRFSVW